MNEFDFQKPKKASFLTLPASVGGVIAAATARRGLGRLAWRPRCSRPRWSRPRCSQPPRSRPRSPPRWSRPPWRRLRAPRGRRGRARADARAVAGAAAACGQARDGDGGDGQRLPPEHSVHLAPLLGSGTARCGSRASRWRTIGGRRARAAGTRGSSGSPSVTTTTSSIRMPADPGGVDPRLDREHRPGARAAPRRAASGTGARGCRCRSRGRRRAGTRRARARPRRPCAGRRRRRGPWRRRGRPRSRASAPRMTTSHAACAHSSARPRSRSA